MRTGRVVFASTTKGILLGAVTEILADGLKFKNSANGEPVLAAKGEAHKVRFDLAKQVKALIGVERPTLREGDAVLVTLKDGSLVAGQIAANVKGDKAKVVLANGAKPKTFDVTAVQAIDGNTESLVRELVGVPLGYHGQTVYNPTTETNTGSELPETEDATETDVEEMSDDDTQDEGDE